MIAMDGLWILKKTGDKENKSRLVWDAGNVVAERFELHKATGNNRSDSSCELSSQQKSERSAGVLVLTW